MTSYGLAKKATFFEIVEQKETLKTLEDKAEKEKGSYK